MQGSLLDLEAVDVILGELEDCLTLARIAQVPGKRGWCLGVGAISALIEDVVYERWGIVGLVKMEVDFSVRCFLCCVCGEYPYDFMSSCDRHRINSSSCKR